MNDVQKTREQLLDELALERARSLALAEVSKRAAATHDTDEVLDLIVNEATRLVGASGGTIRLLEDQSLVLRATANSTLIPLDLQDLQVEEGTSLPGHVMATKAPFFGEEGAKTLSPETRQWFLDHGRDPAARGAVPLLADGRSIGTLSVSSLTYGRRFTDDEIAFLMAFADQAAIAFEKARVLNDAETERERSDALYRVSNLLASAHDTDEVLDLIVNEAARLRNANASYIRILENGLLIPGATTESATAFLEDAGDEQPALIVGDGDDQPAMVSLSGSDLSQVELNGASLQHSNFSLANLRGASIKEAELESIDLRGADLSEIDLTGSDMSRSNLHGVIAPAATLSQVDLSDTDQSGADLRNSNLNGSDLTNTNLSGSNLRNSNLNGSDLTDTNLSGSNLQGTDQSNAKLDNANLSGANLREVILAGASLAGTQFTNIISIEGADFTDVISLDDGSIDYLVSLAKGTNRVTYRQTRNSLKGLGKENSVEGVPKTP